MEARVDLKSLCCLNEECKEYGQKGKENLEVRKQYGRDQIRYLKCKGCGVEFSERKGTSLFNSKIAESKAVSIIEHLDRKQGVVATAELVKVSKDTVSRLNRVAGKVFWKLHDVMVQDIRPKALQFDEKWSFIYKKQKNVLISDYELEVGDHWDCNCIDPQSKLLISLVAGKRTAETISQAVKDAAFRLASDCPIPAIFTDGEDAYKDAILDAFGNRYPAPRSSNKGRPPLPIIRAPQELVYAQVVKHRSGNRVAEVDIRPIFGKGKLDSVVKSLGWNKANTSAIERFNLTDRQRNARKARKSLNFSKQKREHDNQSFINALLYNFHHFHRSLRIKTQQGIIHRTPAQAAGIVTKRFSVLELLRLNPIAC
jgi:IS1 family transposase/transposase-like protein